jgi:hypothetical protein
VKPPGPNALPPFKSSPPPALRAPHNLFPTKYSHLHQWIGNEDHQPLVAK